MSRTKILIVDDEPLAREIIESYLSKLGGFDIVASCEDALEAMAVLRDKPVDLMFLDIQMPKITGLEFLKTLRHPPKVIITTAHREYALDGYELDVLDYLLKPIPFERFMRAINKFYQSSAPSDLAIIESARPVADTGGGYILVRGNRKIFKIAIDQITVIESVKDYVQIFTADKSFVVKQLISELEEKLPSEQFIRIHRSYIVALRYIDSFTASTVEIGTRELPIGRMYRNATFKALKFLG